ncbi:MAG: Flp family type IVb pilin [Proteobacteria bacterium]|nr:Flp family type IVb pilin [Pseudomonadota bacterium]
MRKLLDRFGVQQSGATAIEYALMAALISIVLVGALGPLSVALTDAFQTVANAFPQPAPAPPAP